MRYLSTLSAVLALAASIFWLNYKSGELLAVNGSWLYVPLAIPVFIAGLPVVFPRKVVRGLAAFVLGAFAFLGGLSIGLLYVPSAIAMVAAACVPSPITTRE
jgi:hypothetical protein